MQVFIDIKDCFHSNGLFSVLYYFYYVLNSLLEEAKEKRSLLASLSLLLLNFTKTLFFEFFKGYY